VALAHMKWRGDKAYKKCARSRQANDSKSANGEGDDGKRQGMIYNNALRCRKLSYLRDK